MEERNDPPTMARAHSSVRRPSGVSRTLLVLVATGGLALNPLPASADPEPMTSSEAAALVAEKGRELEAVSEQVNEARERLRRQQSQAAQAADDLVAAEAALVEARGKVGTVARSAWTGSQVGTLETMLTSESLDDLLRRVGTLDSISRYNGGVLTSAASASRDAETAKATAEESAVQAYRMVRRVAAQQDRLDQQISAYKADYERLLSEERAAREAAERAAREAAAERAAAARASRADRTSPSAAAGTAPSGTAPSDTAPSNTAPSAPASPVGGGKPAPAPAGGGSGAAATAVSTALAQRGDPYSWGAAGPNAFDCSGLMQYAYAAAGVSLPHSSRMQAGMGSPVSRSALQPGDLLFYYSPVSHVGMYIGNGQMVHASTYGQPVKVVSINAMPSYSHARRVA